MQAHLVLLSPIKQERGRVMLRMPRPPGPLPQALRAEVQAHPVRARHAALRAVRFDAGAWRVQGAVRALPRGQVAWVVVLVQQLDGQVTRVLPPCTCNEVVTLCTTGWAQPMEKEAGYMQSMGLAYLKRTAARWRCPRACRWRSGHKPSPHAPVLNRS